jgi:hypothetical protein
VEKSKATFARRNLHKLQLICAKSRCELSRNEFGSLNNESHSLCGSAQIEPCRGARTDSAGLCLLVEAAFVRLNLRSVSVGPMQICKLAANCVGRDRFGALATGPLRGPSLCTSRLRAGRWLSGTQQVANPVY